jgi:uncharacterized repeat protein (TIGR02543 family)
MPGRQVSINSSGSTNTTGLVTTSVNAIRPAFKLDLSSVIFTSAAAGGKSSVSVSDDLTAATPLTGAVKLTLKDPSLTLASVTPTAISGRRISFDYTGAAASETLSAAVLNSAGALRYYGKLEAATSANGAGITVTLPIDFAPADKLNIFVEQCNEDYYTDYASAMKQIPVEFPAAPAVSGVDCTIIANNNGQIAGTSTTMEYSADGGATWKACTGSSTAGLVPGDYLARFASRVESGTVYMTSPSKMVTVGPYSVVTAPTAVILTSDLNPSTVGKSVTFSATVTSPGGTPSGDVEFREGAVALGTRALNASSATTFTTSALSLGTHPIIAYYMGGIGYYASNSAVVNQVVKNPDPEIATWNVTVSASHASLSGAGSYEAGAAVTIDAGARPGYTFDGWTASDGVSLGNAADVSTSFIMPARDATVTAAWRAVDTYTVEIGRAHV